MILGIDTSTPVCKLYWVEGEYRHESTWEVGRELAKGLLGYLEEQLHVQEKSWVDITGIVVYRGPGSFTGLRIGSTVANSLAYARQIPIVGELGDTWLDAGVLRLVGGNSDGVVIPEYGGEANITAPRK